MAPPVTRPHAAPVSASHWVDSPNKKWIVSYVTGYDDETLYNIHHRLPLNGTAKLVTQKIVTYFDFDNFASSPVPESTVADIETPVYSTPISFRLMGFLDLELRSPVDDFQPRAMVPEARDLLTYPLNIDRRRTCFHQLFAPLLQNHLVDSTTAIQEPHPQVVAPTIGPLPLGGIAPLAELPPAIIDPCDFESSTSAEVIKLYSFVGYLAMVLVVALAILVIECVIPLLKPPAFRSRSTRAINRLVGLYDAALVHIRTWIFKLRYGFEWIVAFVT